MVRVEFHINDDGTYKIIFNDNFDYKKEIYDELEDAYLKLLNNR